MWSEQCSPHYDEPSPKHTRSDNPARRGAGDRPRSLALILILALAAGALVLGGTAESTRAQDTGQNTVRPNIISGPNLNTPVAADRFSNIYGHGEDIVVSFSFSEPVTVTGSPCVALTIAQTSWAGYSGSSDGGATLSPHRMALA